MTFVIEKSNGNGNQHGDKDVCTCSGCEDILMTISELCIYTNLDILRNINGSHRRGNIG